MSGHRTARVLVYTHRWLGIVSGVLFVVWFVSGIVMMYARMPELDPRERLARLPAIKPAIDSRDAAVAGRRRHHAPRAEHDGRAAGGAASPRAGAPALICRHRRPRAGRRCGSGAADRASVRRRRSTTSATTRD